MEKQQILHVLAKNQGNRTLTAKLLDISVRTLRNKLNEYGVAGKDTDTDDGESPKQLDFASASASA